jgi:hypothetical protein
MINYKNIDQSTPEWLRLKWGKIGGTLSKGLFVDSDTLFIELLSQHIESFDDEEEGYQSDAMIRGKELEPRAIEYISQYTGIQFTDSGWLQSEESKLLGVSPDGISECEEYGVECKCLSRKEHTAILVENKTPKEKIPQIVEYFTANPKFKKVWFISYRPESIKPFIEEFTRESVVDMGWKKKIEVEVIGAKGTPIKPKIENVTDWRTIDDWTKIAIQRANELETRIEEKIKQLKF